MKALTTAAPTELRVLPQDIDGLPLWRTIAPDPVEVVRITAKTGGHWQEVVAILRGAGLDPGPVKLPDTLPDPALVAAYLDHRAAGPAVALRVTAAQLRIPPADLLRRLAPLQSVLPLPSEAPDEVHPVDLHLLSVDADGLSPFGEPVTAVRSAERSAVSPPDAPGSARPTLLRRATALALAGARPRAAAALRSSTDGRRGASRRGPCPAPAPRRLLAAGGGRVGDLDHVALADGRIVHRDRAVGAAVAEVGRGDAVDLHRDRARVRRVG